MAEMEFERERDQVLENGIEFQRKKNYHFIVLPKMVKKEKPKPEIGRLFMKFLYICDCVLRIKLMKNLILFYILFATLSNHGKLE